MKVIIAGSRGIDDLRIVEQAIQQSKFDITEIVSGGARGIDRLGERWAGEHGLPLRTFLPDYKYHRGNIAPILRNQEMALYADALIAIWDGKSKGTKHMIEYMRDKMMKPTEVICPSIKK